MMMQRAALALAGASMLLAQTLAPAATWAQTSAPVASPAPASAGPYQPQDKDERGLWFELDEQERELKTSNFVVRDPTVNAYVHRVMCKVAGIRCSELRLYIMRTPYFNATTAPNGMVQIWSGLLLRTRNEAQLAAVLGHEFVHYRERHSLLLFRQAKSKTSSAMWLTVLTGGLGVLLALGIVGDLFKFSRDQESQADAESLKLMAAAGYDVRQAAAIWEQLRLEQDATAAARGIKSRKDKDRGLFATHPPSAERVTALRAQAAAMTVPANAIVGRDSYVAGLATLWPAIVDDQVKLNDFGGTELLLGALASEGWTPALSYARGELYRARGRADDLTAAAGFYRVAASASDGPIESWRGLGLALLRSGSPEEGKAALKTYLARRPEAADKALIEMLAGS